MAQSPLFQSWNRCRSDACRERILARLRADPRGTAETLASSVERGSEAERVWVTDVAGAVLPKDKASVAIKSAIERLRRHDVKDMAVDNLLKVDLESARYLLSWYRQRIAKEDYTNHGYALWVLARLDDRDGISDVDRLIRRQDIPPYLRYHAEVVRLLLAGDHRSIYRLIAEHDHDRMTWLAEAARRLDTPDAQRSLEACAAHAPDMECRITCRSASLFGSEDDRDWSTIEPVLREEFGPDAFPDPVPAMSRTYDDAGLKEIALINPDGSRRTTYSRPRLAGLVARLTGRSHDRGR